LWSVFQLLDPDPEEPRIYGSDWIRIRIHNTDFKGRKLIFGQIVFYFKLKIEKEYYFKALITLQICEKFDKFIPLELLKYKIAHLWCYAISLGSNSDIL
jgi:hypothetical protein